jgi:hypothetical protein
MRYDPHLTTPYTRLLVQMVGGIGRAWGRGDSGKSSGCLPPPLQGKGRARKSHVGVRLILEHLCPGMHHSLLASGHMATAFILCHFLTRTTNHPFFFLSLSLYSVAVPISQFAFDIATVAAAALVVVTFVWT